MEPSTEALWNQMHGKLCNFICSRIADEDDVEDILQEVFIRVHTHRDSLRETERLESWMYQIARNRIVDYYRGRSRLVPLSETTVADETEEEEAIAGLAPAVRPFIEALPEPYREALFLTTYCGLNQKELADSLGISVAGAKSRVQRGRQKIKEELLAQYCFEFDTRGLVSNYGCRCLPNNAGALC